MRHVLSFVLALCLCLSLPLAASAETTPSSTDQAAKDEASQAPEEGETVWVEHTSEKFGIKMQLPKEAALKARGFEEGWGGFFAVSPEAEFFGVAHLGDKVPLATIQGVLGGLTGLEKDVWSKIDEGKAQSGWDWWQTFQATKGEAAALAVLGHGPKGAYLFVVVTTQTALTEDKATYQQWYDSISLF